MNQYQMQYQSKMGTLEDAYKLLNDGDLIACAYCANAPAMFLSSLSTQREKRRNLKLLYSLGLETYDFLSDRSMLDFVTPYSYFLMGPSRKSYEKGILQFIPSHLHSGVTRQDQLRQADVFVAAVTPMDQHGYFRCSLSNIGERIWLKGARKVILEVNSNLLVVYGDNEIHISDVDCIIESERPVPTLDKGALTAEDIKIGEHVATLVNDGDTIQLGIGSIPDAVAQAFMEKRDLGVHTEMITNSIVDLVERGVVTGKRKSLHPGKIVGTFALGNQRLYDFMHHNPSVLLLPGDYVNNPFVVAQNDNMVSINTSFAVDFTGQVSSEAIGPVQYSGTGGQSDTAFGAIHARNGRSVIALKSTVKGGTISSIQPVFSQGSIVTLSRNNVDYIVTEYGIANLKDKCLNDRAKALIGIAHPKFRDELTEAAKQMRYL